MTSLAALDRDGELAGRAAIPVRRASRRDEFEGLGLLFGILAVLLILAVTAGVAPPA
jgi:hypothetical protein